MSMATHGSRGSQALWAALWIATLVAAFAVGRHLGAGSPGGPAVQGSGSFADALTELDPLRRAHRIAASLQDFGPDDVDAALAGLEAHSVGVTPEEVRLLMLAWARFDGSGAFAWARAYPKGWRRVLTSEAMFAWGYHDGAAALQALEATGDEDLVSQLRPVVMDGWLRGGDLAATTAYVAAVDDPKRRRRLNFALAGEVLKRGVPELMAWAEGVPEDAPNQFKQGAFYHASAMIARESPRTAADWFERHARDWYSEGSLPGIARKWAEFHDAPTLFEWLLELELEPAPGREAERDEAITAGFRVWARRAPQEAETWLRASLPDAKLSPAIVELVRALAPAQPAAAVTWAALVEDETERRRATIYAGRSWWRRDREAAQAWLEASDLPEDVRKQIQERPRAALARRAPGAPAKGAPVEAAPAATP
jgi:hypothetical protein